MMIIRNKYVLVQRNYLGTYLTHLLFLSVILPPIFFLPDKVTEIFLWYWWYCFLPYLVLNLILLTLDTTTLVSRYNEYNNAKGRVFINKYFILLNYLGEELGGAIGIKKYPFITILEYRIYSYLYITVRKKGILKKNDYARVQYLKSKIKEIVDMELKVSTIKTRRKAFLIKIIIPGEKIPEGMSQEEFLVNSCERIGNLLSGSGLI